MGVSLDVHTHTVSVDLVSPALFPDSGEPRNASDNFRHLK